MNIPWSELNPFIKTTGDLTGVEHARKVCFLLLSDYVKAEGMESDVAHTVLAYFLANMAHLADWLDLDFKDVIAQARKYYVCDFEETVQEPKGDWG